MKKLKYLILAVCSGMTVCSVAQSVLPQAKVVCPDSVVCHNEFVYSVTVPVDSGYPVIVVPPFKEAGLDVMSGPSLDRMHHVMNVNGKNSEIRKVSYSYKLKCDQVKTIVIPEYIIKSGRNVRLYKVPVREISCMPASSLRQKTRGKMDSTFVLVRPELSKDRIRLGDSIRVVMKLYTSENLNSVEKVRRIPDYSLASDIETDSVMALMPDTLNGRKCASVILDQYWIYPLKTGKYELPSIRFAAQIKKMKEGVDPFEAFFDGDSSYDYTTIHATTEPLFFRVSKGEQEIDSPVREKTDYVRSDMLLALDISGSMGGLDFPLSRLDVAKGMIDRLASDRPCDVVPFSDQRREVLAIPQMENELSSLKCQEDSRTALYDVCLSAVYDNLYHGRHYSDVVLFTDGHDNGSHVSLRTVADVMAAMKIRVHIVKFNAGKDSVRYNMNGQLLSFPNQLAGQQDDLSFLAGFTGGGYWELTDMARMDRVVSEIRQNLSSSELNADISGQTSLSGFRMDLLLEKIYHQFYLSPYARSESESSEE